MDPASEGCSFQHSQQEQVRSSALPGTPQLLSPSPLQHLYLAQAREAAAPSLQQKHSGPMKALIQGRSKGGHSPQAPTEGLPCSPQSTAEASPPWGSTFVAMGAPMPWL